jgi:hypothetical protein
MFLKGDDMMMIDNGNDATVGDENENNINENSNEYKLIVLCKMLLV